MSVAEPGSKFSARPGPCTSERRLGASAVLKVFCDRRDFHCLLTSIAKHHALLSTIIAIM